MSFTGDLEHLPIVDIIQLLHAARKSGTLTIHNRKGDNQLVFRDGFIVSANNARNTVRIGKVLVEINAIDEATLEQALAEQKSAGAERKPLIATLLEKGMVDKEEAFKGLEILIEKTVLEVLIWKEGSFTFDVDVVNVSDEYRYIPEMMKREINLNSQNVLMEALRLYDEKKRDGDLESEFAGEEALAPDSPLAPVATPAADPTMAGETAGSEEPLISADILGLDQVEKLERKIPEVFVGLADPEPEPDEVLRRKLRENAPELTAEQRESLAAYLLPFVDKSAGDRAATGETHAVILYSPDRLLAYGTSLVCKHDGLLAFATTDDEDLDMILGQSLAKGLTPIVLFDAPIAGEGPFAHATLDGLRARMREQYPQAALVQLVTADDTGYALAALTAGAREILPRPWTEDRPPTIAADLVGFLQALRAWLHTWARHRDAWLIGRLRETCRILTGQNEPRDIAFSLLQFVSGIFERALILIVAGQELLGDRGLGVRAPRSAGGQAVTDLRFALDSGSLPEQTVTGVRPYLGPVTDALLEGALLDKIGRPKEDSCLLLPIACYGKTRFLIYADFGSLDVSPIPMELLEILAGQGGLVLENVLYRKRLQKAAG